MTRPDMEGATQLGSTNGGHMRRIGLMLGLSLAIALLSGCEGPKRITVTELAQLEGKGVETPPTPVPAADLGLAEVHPYLVQSRDVLSIKMFGLASDAFAPTTIELRVHDDGNIVAPAGRTIAVQGLTLNQVEQAIISAYVPAVVKESQGMAVYVQLIEPETTTVLVLGAVNTPGFVKLRQNERNVLYALAQAGGFGLSTVAVPTNATGSGRVHYKPIRPERGETIFNLDNVNDVRRALVMPPLESGDILVVDTSEQSAVYVSGLVNRAGPIMIPRAATISLVQAVAAAGGLRDYMIIDEGTLIRTLANGQQVQVRINLLDIMEGREPDLALKPGDVLHIPQTLGTLAQEWAWKNLMPGPFNVGLHYDPLAQYNAERALKNNQTRSSLKDSLGSTLPNLLVPAVQAP